MPTRMMIEHCAARPAIGSTLKFDEMAVDRRAPLRGGTPRRQSAAPPPSRRPAGEAAGRGGSDQDDVLLNGDDQAQRVTTITQGTTNTGTFKGIGAVTGAGLEGASTSGIGMLGTTTTIDITGVVETTATPGSDLAGGFDLDTGVYGFANASSISSGLYQRAAPAGASTGTPGRRQRPAASATSARSPGCSRSATSERQERTRTPAVARRRHPRYGASSPASRPRARWVSRRADASGSRTEAVGDPCQGQVVDRGQRRQCDELQLRHCHARLQPFQPLVRPSCAGPARSPSTSTPPRRPPPTSG